MYRSFFPEPRIFFPLSLLWLLLTTILFFTGGEQVRNVVGLDRFVAPAICQPGQVPLTPPAAEALPEAPPAVALPDGGPPAPGGAPPPEGAVAEAAPAGTPTNCVVEDDRFLNGDRIWLYQYVLMVALLFCVFWYFYKRNEWYWWSVVGSAVILLVIFFNVQIEAWINDWQGTFFNMLQQALSQPRSVAPADFYFQIIVLFAVLMPNILVLVLLAFFTSHYVFRWRKAMNSYYMSYWPAIRKVEGAAQRVQEDTMRFAQIVEGLGTNFFESLITLAVFLPLLWGFSQRITEVPIFGDIPGSLVWVALIAAAFGTGLLAFVGIKLPGLQFNNQLVEAAYRKELVYGEDNSTRADPLSVREFFASVQRNYFRIYFHYTYFNLVRYSYLNIVGYVPLLAMSPSILAGTLTLGLYQQIQAAFGQVSASFQFFARVWTTIVELLSVRQRLKHFESFIPKDQLPIKESLSNLPPPPGQPAPAQ